ncbi:membrane bound O-acyl transferase family-domain-containing protein [Aspergillus aurantiobrunneus]
MSTPRGVGTAYETKDLKYHPSCRWKFLTWNLFVLGFQYLLMDLVTHQPTSPMDIERFFSPGREYLLFRPDDVPSPTLAEAVIHLAVTLVAWGPMGASFISIFYRIVALLSVALGISSPNQWPSLFGSISDTYRLRRFWGRYWHQLLRQPFQGITKLITRNVLRLPHQSRLARYLGLVLVFACSALLHACMDAKAGIGFKLSGAWACFLLQAVGITLEDTAVGVYTRVFGDSQSQSQSTPLWVRLLGYVWVWGFLALVAPLYQFPLMRGQDPMRTGMPVSVVRWLRAYFAV